MYYKSWEWLQSKGLEEMELSITTKCKALENESIYKYLTYWIQYVYYINVPWKLNKFIADPEGF